jgi:glutamate dehydrogenase/leucine dehydrogenase
VKIHKLSSTDAFIAFDLDDAPAVGVTRLARKVLRDGAALFARSTTYSFATFGIQMGGGSAGINADGDAVDPAVASFVDETKELVSSGLWATDPGLGLTEDDLAPLRIEDRRPPELWTASLAPQLVALGAIGAARAVRGEDVSGATATLVGAGPSVDAARLALDRDGVTITGGDADAQCDLLFLAGKTGMLDHEQAASVRAGMIIPLTPVPVTARAHAVLTQGGRIHLPDFLTTAGPLLHAHDSAGGEPVDRVAEVAAELASEGTGLWLAAAQRAEDFLRTWRDELPFGRPLA